MDSAPYPSAIDVTGLNLENYFPTKCTYDSVIYIHKKFLPKYKQALQKDHGFSDPKKTLDKCQQFDSEKLGTMMYKVKETFKNKTNIDPVVEQTIRFAKDIIPLTIPPSNDVSQHTIYTVKALKKSKKKTHNLKSVPAKDETYYEKEKDKNEFHHFKRDKLKRHRDNASVGETISSSQNNTLDDINENRTLSCTLSEISEKKHKEDRHCKRNKRNEMQKVAVSESFEAVATEFMNTSSDTKIKIHLMNERDKNLFCQNIQTPVIESIKECIMELNNNNLKTLRTMQSSIEQQTKKLDFILGKLSSLEEKLVIYTKPSTTNLTHSTTTKVSKLEELCEDIVQVKRMYSSDEEELGQVEFSNKNEMNRSVKEIKIKDKILVRDNRKTEKLGCGEEVSTVLKAQMGVKADRVNRAPARYCWTDAGRSN